MKDRIQVQAQGWGRTTLGRTGWEVGRMGLAAGYGRKLTAQAVEQCVEEGSNYLYWGSMRWGGFGEALKNLKSQRGRVVLVLQSYTRIAGLMGWSVERGLRRIGYEQADVLLLGMWNKIPPARILDAARALKERGLVRRLAVSSHNRPLVAELARTPGIDIVHVRYNAAHPGAEREIFPAFEKGPGRAGLVSFTATSWGQLISGKKVPKGERTPTAEDCYRFVLTNPAVDVCMAGPANDYECAAIRRALAAGPLNEEEMAWMRRVGAAVHG